MTKDKQHLLELIERLMAKRVLGDLDKEIGFGRVLVADPDCTEAAEAIQSLLVENELRDRAIAVLMSALIYEMETSSDPHTSRKCREAINMARTLLGASHDR